MGLIATRVIIYWRIINIIIILQYIIVIKITTTITATDKVQMIIAPRT